MNDCKSVKIFIDRYIKGELDKRKRIYLENHIKNCIMCSAEMELARKRVSVAQLLSSLQPSESFLKRIVNAPDRIKQKIKKIFRRHPVAIPAALIFFFIIPLFGILIRTDILYKENTSQMAQTEKKAEEPAAPDINSNSSDTAPLKVEKRVEKKNEEPIEKPVAEKQKEKKNEQIAQTPSDAQKHSIASIPEPEPAPKGKVKIVEEKIIKNDDKVIAAVKKQEKTTEDVEVRPVEDQKGIEAKTKAKVEKNESNIDPDLYRITFTTKLNGELVFTNIEALSEKLNALILSSQGFSTIDSDLQKRILVRVSKKEYERFFAEIEARFTDVIAQADKNIKIPNDLSLSGEDAFLLIEIN